jgi:hypothetical protein
VRDFMARKLQNREEFVRLAIICGVNSNIQRCRYGEMRE